MTLQEFNVLSGMNVTEEEFPAINDLYINTPYDKTDFCALYAKANGAGRELAQEVSSQTTFIDNQLTEKITRINTLQAKIDAAADALVDLAAETEDDNARDKALAAAETLVGERELLKIKVRKGIYLTEQEVDYILAALEDFKG